MKKLILILIALVSGFVLKAQQEPLFAQYRSNLYLLNPAYAGQSGMMEVRLNYRAQWLKMARAPRTVVASVQGPVSEKHGLGMVVFNDLLGPTRRNGVQGGYSYRLPVGTVASHGQHYLSLGISLKLMQYRFAMEEIYFTSQQDAALENIGTSYMLGDVAFGAFFSNDYFFAGFSAPNLIQSSFRAPELNDIGVLGGLAKHYFMVMGYRFNYDQVSVEPSVLIRKVDATPYQIEGTVKFYFANDQLITGISYRTGWLGSFMVGVKPGKMQIMYSTDFLPIGNGIQRNFGTSHEISIGWDIGEPQTSWRRQYYSPGER